MILGLGRAAVHILSFSSIGSFGNKMDVVICALALSLFVAIESAILIATEEIRGREGAKFLCCLTRDRELVPWRDVELIGSLLGFSLAAIDIGKSFASEYSAYFVNIKTLHVN
jgi:hypothetical protein